MRLDTAHRQLDKYYQTARDLNNIKDPVAWALYQTWREADKDKVSDFCRKCNFWLACRGKDKESCIARKEAMGNETD